MAEITGEDPAFPTIESINHGGDIVEIKTCEVGLSKREYFAAMAMQGLTSNPLTEGMEMEAVRNDKSKNGYDATAYQAVRYADALIAALNK